MSELGVNDSDVACVCGTQAERQFVTSVVSRALT